MSLLLALLLATATAHAAPLTCVPGEKDPLIAIRAEIDAARKAAKTRKTFHRQIDEWLASEKGDTIHPLLGWIRVVDPWILPNDFPAKGAFEECAADLRTYSDARAAKKQGDGSEAKAALQEWSACLDLIYTGEKPVEFRALKSCLNSSAGN